MTAVGGKCLFTFHCATSTSYKKTKTKFIIKKLSFVSGIIYHYYTNIVSEKVCMFFSQSRRR